MGKYRAEDNHLFDIINRAESEPKIYYEIKTKSTTKSDTGNIESMLHEIKVAMAIWKEVNVYAKEYK